MLHLVPTAIPQLPLSQSRREHPDQTAQILVIPSGPFATRFSFEYEFELAFRTLDYWDVGSEFNAAIRLRAQWEFEMRHAGHASDLRIIVDHRL